MTRAEFNIAIAEKVMGWEAKESKICPGEILKRDAETGCYVRTYDFTRDHNAAALVLEQVSRLPAPEVFQVTLANAIGPDWRRKDTDGVTVIMSLLTATPEQIARAAFWAVTGKELEAIDAI